MDTNLDFTLNNYINQAFKAKEDGDFSKAIDCYEKALDICNNLEFETMVIFDIVALLRRTGDYKKSIICLEKYIEKNSAFLSMKILKESNLLLKRIQILDEFLNRAKIPNLPEHMVPTIIALGVEHQLNLWKEEQDI